MSPVELDLRLVRPLALVLAVATVMDSGVIHAREQGDAGQNRQQQGAPQAAGKKAGAPEAEAQPQSKGPDPATVEFFKNHVDVENQTSISLRDGTRLDATLLFPKDRPRENLPTVMWFFPYQITKVEHRFENKALLEHGYAVAIVNVRGRYFSEGVYTYLGGSGRDSSDTIDWIAKQKWSNGKVGALGCSSSAEEQNKMNAMQNPHFRAAIPRSAGAGIGVVGPYAEMGNFYRGGVRQNFWFEWYQGWGYKYKPSFDPNLTHAQMLKIDRQWDLEPETIVSVDFAKELGTTTAAQILQRDDVAPSDMDDFVTWPVDDPHWKTIEFGSEGDRNGAPALYVNAWYDLSTGPNLAMLEYQAKNAANKTARDNAITVIAPTLHCEQERAKEHTIVGERDMGDARFDYMGLYLRWYDHWLKGVDNGVEKEPKARVYLMGANQWRAYTAWPPREAQPVTYYLDSDGSANTSMGNGRLATAKPAKNLDDRYTYDPMNPAPNVGGQLCCAALKFGSSKPGSFDQSELQKRADVLVYTSEPLKQTVEVTGKIPVTLYLSSDVKDTDVMVTLVDKAPDGKAWNLDMQALRVRYRDGYGKQVLMKSGEVYRLDMPPLVTSNAFLPGHRIQVEITSSAFPFLDRNMNTGGPSYNEKDAVTAHNVIHHGPIHLSSISLPIVPSGTGKIAAAK